MNYLPEIAFMLLYTYCALCFADWLRWRFE